MTEEERMQWEEKRLQGIGCSDLGAIYNLDMGCRRKLFYEKTRAPKDFPKKDLPEFERGHLLEPVIIQLYGMRTKRQTKPDQRMIWHPNPEIMLFVHMDALTADNRMPDERKVDP